MSVGGQVGAPKRNKKASKKKKASWRKNVDLDDVEDFLEDKRLEERLGGDFDSRKDEDLFLVDAAPEGEAQPAPDRLKKRRQLEARPLKCFAHLEVKSGAADPKKGRNARKLPEQRENPIVKSIESRLRDKGVVKAKVRMAKRHREGAAERKKAAEKEAATRRRTEFDFDLWGSKNASGGGGEAAANDKDVVGNEWVGDNAKRHHLRNTGRLRKAPPKDYRRKVSDLAAVDTPHAGASYNPSYKDHQDLLREAWLTEVNKERAQHRIDYHTTRMYPAAHEAPTEKTWIAEMSEEIAAAEDKESDEGESEESDAEGSEEEDEAGERPSSTKLKTRQQRRKAKERMAAQRRVEGAKKRKQVHQDVMRIKSLKREIAAEERRVAEKSAVRAAVKRNRQRTTPLQLSKHGFEEPDKEIKLSEELTGNLRSLKPEGNLLEDRYKSLQRRNLVETRTRTKIVKKKHKRKKLEKRSYKMPWQKTF